MIDFHAHIGRMFRERHPREAPLTSEQLVDRMNREGIAMSVLLPLESPEGSWGYFLTEEAVAARDLFPERFIAFACVDPRYPHAAQLLDHAVNAWGCRGFGEHVCGLAFDDPLCKALYAKCDELGLPLVFEICDAYCYDEVGLPRLEACLHEFPNIAWVGHGPQFWSAISADDPRTGYPGGPIVAGGAVDRLLSEYPNLYADLSAHSGYNAMTRDPDFATGFVERHAGKLLFGTDVLAPGQDLPIVRWMRESPMSDNARRLIASENAARLLGRGA
jgi:hypothetical protein